MWDEKGPRCELAVLVFGGGGGGGGMGVWYGGGGNKAVGFEALPETPA